MSIDAIAAIGATDDTFAASAAMLAPTAAPQVAGGFGAWFSTELNNINTTLARADSDIQKLALGEAPSLHEVMIHMEEAKLSFQLLAQVRNRLLESYQEVMRMQV